MITRDSKNILIADNNVLFRTKLSEMLVEAGHKVRFAKDGREVLNEIGTDSKRLDLLMLDLQMPEIDGFGVLKWIDENGFKGRFPVLVISGVHEPVHVMERLKEFGATGLMTKDSTPEQMIFRVNRMLFSEKIQHGGPRGRVPVSLPVDFVLGDVVKTGALLNLSETGTFLHTKDELFVGSLIRLKFTLPNSGGRLLDLKGIVKWSTNDVASKTLFGGYGVMFTSFTEEEQAVLKGFVDSEIKKLGLDTD